MNSYFSLVRKELFPFIPDTTECILEVGCGTGATLAAWKKTHPQCQIFGVEIDARAAAAARRHLDQVVFGDVEALPLPFKRGQFDTLLLPDVLEHLREPERVVKKLLPFLRLGGVVVVSVPNLQHLSILKQVFWHGRFDYEEAGILDRTHLRWFTKATIVELLERQGLQVTDVSFNGGRLTGWKRALDWLSGGRLQPLFVAQWIVQAIKAPALTAERDISK